MKKGTKTLGRIPENPEVLKARGGGGDTFFWDGERGEVGMRSGRGS